MPITRRRQIIEDLLDHLPDFEPTPQVAGAIGGSGAPPRMPAIFWEREVQELYRSLDLLRLEPEIVIPTGHNTFGSKVHAHLTAYYHCELRIVRPMVKRLHGRRWRRVESEPGQWKRERVVSRWLNLTLVELGVEYVDSVYGGGINGRLQPLFVSQLVERLERKAGQMAAA